MKRRLFLCFSCVLLTLGTTVLGFAAGGFLALRYHAALIQWERFIQSIKPLFFT